LQDETARNFLANKACLDIHWWEPLKDRVESTCNSE